MPSSLQLAQATVEAGEALFCRRDGKIMDQVLAQSNLAVIGLVYGGIKPINMPITIDERVKLADFEVTPPTFLLGPLQSHLTTLWGCVVA